MIINHTNHPQTHWGETQIAAVEEKYGTLVDTILQNIPKNMTTNDITEIVNELMDRWMDLDEIETVKAVVIQGEYAYTHALMEELKKHKIQPILFTNDMIKKEFREYPRFCP